MEGRWEAKSMRGDKVAEREGERKGSKMKDKKVRKEKEISTKGKEIDKRKGGMK